MTGGTQWREQRKQWVALYVRHVEASLQRAIEYVRASRSTDDLRDYYDSLLTLIRQGMRWAETRTAAMRLVVALVPWPERWKEWESWEPVLRAALDVARRVGDRRARAILSTSLGWTYFRTGKHDRAYEAGEEAVEIAAQEEMGRTLVIAGGLLINILVYGAEYDRAAQKLWEVEAELRRLRRVMPPAVYQEALDRLRLEAVPILRRQGRVEAALRLSQGITRHLQASPAATSYLLPGALTMEGVMLWVMGDYVASLEVTEKAMAGFAQLGDEASVAELYGNVGLICWSMGRLDWAESNLRQCIVKTEESNALWQLSRCVGDLGLTYLSQGRLEQALAAFEQHIELARHIADTPEVIRGIGNRGALWYHLGEYDKAIADLQEDLRYRTKPEATPDPVVMSSANLGRVYRALGEEERAYAYVMQALDVALASRWLPLRILAYRAWAEFPPRRRQERLLRWVIRQSAALHRHLDEAAGWLALAAITRQPRLRHRYWNLGARLLEVCGADRWLEGHNEYRPPELPLCV